MKDLCKISGASAMHASSDPKGGDLRLEGVSQKRVCHKEGLEQGQREHAALIRRQNRSLRPKSMLESHDGK